MFLSERERRKFDQVARIDQNIYEKYIFETTILTRNHNSDSELLRKKISDEFYKNGLFKTSMKMYLHQNFILRITNTIFTAGFFVTGCRSVTITGE